MSIPIVIDKFYGIAPRYAPELSLGYAVTAVNCDLSSGKIKPYYGPRLVQEYGGNFGADASFPNSMLHLNNRWLLDQNADYLYWRLGARDVVFYLVDGVPWKMVERNRNNQIFGTLGQTRPSTPTYRTTGTGALNDTYYYIYTITRNINGHTDESGPSEALEITLSSEQIILQRPSADMGDTHTHWTIYRMSNTSGEYQFVFRVAAAISEHTDNTPDSELGDAPTTWFTSYATSTSGISIIFDKPQVTFDGMIQEPYSGMIFAWDDASLYWNEPGYPDGWPSVYRMDFPSAIIKCIPIGGALAVLTQNGPFRVDGSHPELLQQSKLLGKEPCTAARAATTNKGVIYLSDSGLARFNLIDSLVITDPYFTETWFNNNIPAHDRYEGRVHIVENDGMVYLFYPTGVLVGDLRLNPIVWTNLNIIAYAAMAREDDGKLYYCDDDGVQEFNGDLDSYMGWTWKSGRIYGNHQNEKPFHSIEVIGDGEITATIDINGTQRASKTIRSYMKRDRVLKVPEDYQIGNHMQFQLAGTGEVDKVIIEHSP